MLKRTALVLTLAAALVAAAPTAPASPVAADIGSGHPAWSHFMDSNAMAIVSIFTCSLTPLALGMTGPGGAVFGIGCGLTSWA